MRISKGYLEDFYYIGEDEEVAQVEVTSDELRLYHQMENLFLEYQAILRNKVRRLEEKASE